MSILIKGMEMPESCDTCFLSKWDTCNERFYCMFDDCPLVEVPAPHGDLIDRDALNIGEYEREDDDSGMLLINISGLLDVYNKIKDAPPVIAAEVSE